MGQSDEQDSRGTTSVGLGLFADVLSAYAREKGILGIDPKLLERQLEMMKAETEEMKASVKHNEHELEREVRIATMHEWWMVVRGILEIVLLAISILLVVDILARPNRYFDAKHTMEMNNGQHDD